MKIAINTLVGYYNYGNRLQNYALQKVLEDMGNEVVTLRNITDIKRSFLVRLSVNLKEGTFFKKIYRYVDSKENVTGWKEANRIRERRFKKFTDQFIHETSFVINEQTTDFSFDEGFDCYVIGSDQVWNYGFNSFSPLDFIMYSNKPKISYAASFGVSKIPPKYVSVYKRGLKQLDYISVREDAGQKLVSDISGRDSEVVLDPTLLLNDSQWLSLVGNSQKLNERYILTYFLDEALPENKRYIEEFAKNNGLKIKRLLSKSDLTLWKADPSDFIDLFSKADVIFTDSFHASVFSIIFKKYFEVFKRNNNGPSMNSRLETLLDDLSLNDRWHTVDSRLVNIDYKKVEKRLAFRKSESMDFLQSSLSKIKNKGNNNG